MSAQLLPLERTPSRDGDVVVTIWLEQPERSVVVLDRALLDRLDATLDEVGEHAGGVVVASRSTRVFVAGADLGEIQSLSDQELDDYLAFGQRVLGRLASLPCATVAAVSGAALGGGLELAMHCDMIFGLRPSEGDKPYHVGLPEASLGLCPGWGGTNLLPARVEPGVAIGMTAAGATVPPDEADKLGIFDAMFDSQDDLLTAARKAAAAPKAARSRAHEPRNLSMPEHAQAARAAMQRVEADLPESEPARAVVAAVNAGLEGGWSNALREERAQLVRLRATDATQAKLRAFFERSAGAKR